MKGLVLVSIVAFLFIFSGNAFAVLTDTQESYSGSGIDSMRSTQDTSWEGSGESSDTSDSATADSSGDIEI